MMNKAISAILFTLSALGLSAQNIVSTTDTTYYQQGVGRIETEITVTEGAPTNIAPQKSPYKFRPTQLIVPGALITVGAIGTHNHWFRGINKEVKRTLEKPVEKSFIGDDIMQYTPLASLYGLKLMGLNSKHNYRDMTILAGTTYVILEPIVYGLKTIVSEERPDFTKDNSFPSGHTATAFAGAELLRREYWDVSPWIGVAGYTVASATGLLRIYNNRHWLNDVLAGAGIGILSVQAAYWLYPTISKHIVPKKYSDDIYLAPNLSAQAKGISGIITF